MQVLVDVPMVWLESDRAQGSHLGDAFRHDVARNDPSVAEPVQ